MDRKKALLFIVKNDILLLTKEQREELLLEWWCIDESDVEFIKLPLNLQVEILEHDEPVDDVMDSKYIPLLEEAMLHEYYGVTNNYLSKKCSMMKGSEIEVIGNTDHLEKCPCCGYRTIKERGFYEICPVCYWEDNGVDEINRYSSPNHMSIEDYRQKNVRLNEEMVERYSD